MSNLQIMIRYKKLYNYKVAHYLPDNLLYLALIELLLINSSIMNKKSIIKRPKRLKCKKRNLRLKMENQIIFSVIFFLEE